MAVVVAVVTIMVELELVVWVAAVMVELVVVHPPLQHLEFPIQAVGVAAAQILEQPLATVALAS